MCVWLIHKCISRNIDGSTCGTDAGKVWGGGLASICYETHVLHKSKARRREGGGERRERGVPPADELDCSLY